MKTFIILADVSHNFGSLVTRYSRSKGAYSVVIFQDSAPHFGSCGPAKIASINSPENAENAYSPRDLHYGEQATDKKEVLMQNRSANRIRRVATKKHTQQRLIQQSRVPTSLTVLNQTKDNYTRSRNAS